MSSIEKIEIQNVIESVLTGQTNNEPENVTAQKIKRVSDILLKNSGLISDPDVSQNLRTLENSNININIKETLVDTVRSIEKINQNRANELGAFRFREVNFPQFPKQFQDPLIEMIDSNKIIARKPWSNDWSVVPGKGLLDESTIFNEKLLEMIDNFDNTDKIGLLFQFMQFPSITSRVLSDPNLNFKVTMQELVMESLREGKGRDHPMDPDVIADIEEDMQDQADSQVAAGILIVFHAFASNATKVIESILRHPGFYFGPLPDDVNFKKGIAASISSPEIDKSTIDVFTKNSRIQEVLSSDREFLQALRAQGQTGSLIASRLSTGLSP